MLNTGGIYVETVTIAVAGVAQRPTSAIVPDGAEVIVLSHPSNTGSIKVADTAAKAQAALGAGNVPLAGSVAGSFQVSDPNFLLLDATVAGERAIIYFEY